MELIIAELLEKGIEENNIILINLEKRGFKNIRTSLALENKIDELALSSNKSLTKFLFIDEIQYVNGFEEVINAFRAEGDLYIFITGSNSYLLSSEIGTRLTGRYISLEVLSLNFEEYESMNFSIKSL